MKKLRLVLSIVGLMGLALFLNMACSSNPAPGAPNFKVPVQTIVYQNPTFTFTLTNTVTITLTPTVTNTLTVTPTVTLTLTPTVTPTATP